MEPALRTIILKEAVAFALVPPASVRATSGVVTYTPPMCAGAMWRGGARGDVRVGRGPSPSTIDCWSQSCSRTARLFGRPAGASSLAGRAYAELSVTVGVFVFVARGPEHVTVEPNTAAHVAPLEEPRRRRHWLGGKAPAVPCETANCVACLLLARRRASVKRAHACVSRRDWIDEAARLAATE